MNRIIFTLFCLLVINNTIAQYLKINGNILIENASPENSVVSIYKNGLLTEEQIINRKGHFELKLALGYDYKLEFKKEGYINKQVAVNTEIPDEIFETNPNFPPIKLIITLLPQVSQIDLSIFKQPIAILAYNAEIDDFIFDKEYDKNIREQLAQTEKQIKTSIRNTNIAFPEKQKNAPITMIQPEGKITKEKTSEQQGKSLNTEISLSPQREEKYIPNTKESTTWKKYQQLISLADSVFNNNNYTLAKKYYNEAYQTRPEENYPIRKLQEIENIIHSAKYKMQVEEYKQIKSLAEKYMQEKNYAAAKVYYQKALAILSTDREEINRHLSEIEHNMEATQLSAIEKTYKEFITKANQAFEKRDYAIARFYYQKALKIKINDKTASNRLQEIEQLIKAAQKQ